MDDQVRTGRRALLLAVGLVLAACGGSDDDEAATTTTAANEPVVFDVTLDGAAEAPGPGDEGGTGTAEISVDPDGTEVCYTLTVSDIDDVTAAHIHEGREGTAGPIAVTLDAPANGRSEGCAPTSSSIVEGITTGTRSFYVNVHSAEFPDGAVRAQLSS